MDFSVLVLISGVVTLAVGATGWAVIRTQTNANRISLLETAVDPLRQLPTKIEGLERELADIRKHFGDYRTENKEDHNDIKRLLADSEKRVLLAFSRTNGGYRNGSESRGRYT